MGLHMLGSKKIILQRGKEAVQTPIGRGLFSFFLRTDMQSSVVTGNPMFLDETWWKNDPLYHMAIPQEAPILLASDAALVKLTALVAKITLLKSYATKKTKSLQRKMEEDTGSGKNYKGMLSNLEQRVRKQVNDLQRELEDWHRGLPVWFSSLHTDQMADGEEDINSSDFIEIRPQRYPHHSIAVVLSCAFAANIQLWRVANPDEYNPPPLIGALVHAIFRAFLATPPSADSMTLPGVWIGACYLRRQVHREWLEDVIKRRIRDTGFWCWSFAYAGILHQWATVDGKLEGRFKSMPQGAQEVVPGVSENLWHADGVMVTKMSVLAKEDDVVATPGGQRSMYRFKGDTQLFQDKDSDEEDEEVEEQTDETTEPESPEVPRRIPLNSSFIDDY